MDGLEKRMEDFARGYPGVRKAALSFSGGLDSAVVGTLLSKAGFEVVPVVANLGQHSDFGRISRNAREMFGSCATIDAREWLSDSILRAAKSNFGSDDMLNGDGFIRPVLARVLAEAARKHGCAAVAHGSSGFGNGHIAIENSLRVLAPELRIMAPVRDLDMRRDETLQYAKKHRIPTNLHRANEFSSDESLWARVIRQGVSVDQSHSLPSDSYKWTVSPQDAPAKAEQISLEFQDGIPISLKIRGRKITGKVKIIESLNEIGGRHALGRKEAFEDKIIGLKIREVYECPAASILIYSHQKLEELALTSREMAAKRSVDAAWASLVREGGWHTRLRRALDAFVDVTQLTVDGTVTLELYRGSITLKGRESPHALYDTRLSSRVSKGAFSQKDARAFAKLHGLQDVMAYLLDGE